MISINNVDKSHAMNAENAFLLSLSVLYIFATHYLQINRSGVGIELPFNTMGWIPLSLALGAGLYVIAKTESFRYTGFTVKITLIVSLLVLPFFCGAEAPLR